jgi:hypothetical protein
LSLNAFEEEQCMTLKGTVGRPFAAVFLTAAALLASLAVAAPAQASSATSCRQISLPSDPYSWGDLCIRVDDPTTAANDRVNIWFTKHGGGPNVIRFKFRDPNGGFWWDQGAFLIVCCETRGYTWTFPWDIGRGTYAPIIDDHGSSVWGYSTYNYSQN